MKGSPTGVLRIVLLSGLDIKCNRSRRRDRLENYFEYQPVKLRFINNRKKMRATFHFENFPVETFFMEVRSKFLTGLSRSLADYLYTTLLLFTGTDGF